MLAVTDPQEAYRRSQLDARVHGGDPAELVRLCLEHVIAGLGGAVLAHARAEPTARSKALTRALTALTALEMGVDRDAGLATVLLQFYGSARRAMLDSVTGFDADALEQVRRDFIDIAGAMGTRPLS
jgi:flagellar protein FliS